MSVWAVSATRTLAVGPTTSQAEVLLWVGILIGLVMVATVVILLLRRRYVEQEPAAPGAGGLLDQLRGMRDRGEISEAEFERTKRAIVAGASGQPRPVDSALENADESDAEPDTLVAEEGYDLTGAPLPRVGGGSE